ncbi:MAG: hypothetical protein WD689_06630 [Gaiellaceae bacterium]
MAIIAGVEWTRAALESRVGKLAEEHEGAELVAAIERFGEQLDEEERALLGRVLLARARGAGVPADYPKWSVILPRRRRRR